MNDGPQSLSDRNNAVAWPFGAVQVHNGQLSRRTSTGLYSNFA